MNKKKVIVILLIILPLFELVFGTLINFLDISFPIATILFGGTPIYISISAIILINIAFMATIIIGGMVLECFTKKCDEKDTFVVDDDLDNEVLVKAVQWSDSNG
jgi:hypothetical protein